MSIGDRFKKGLGGVKTRSMMVVVIVIILVVAVLTWTALRDTDGVLGGGSNVKRVKPIASLPGTGTPSVVYDPLQEQQNQAQADAAKASGGSAVPSLINQGDDIYGRGGFGNLNDGTGRCGDECFDQSGYDQQGYNRDGFDKNGFDRNGYDKDGYDKDGFDRQGYDRDGYDKNGCSRQGLDREGNKCGYDKDGYDADGYDKNGLDKNGYDKNGFDRNGCNKEGKNKAGRDCYNAQGLTEDGFDRAGYDQSGYDRDGLDRQGFNKEGLDAQGYDRLGFNKEGCNKEGLTRDGKPCGAVVAAEDDFSYLLSEGLNADGTSVNAQTQAMAQMSRLLAEQRQAEAERVAALTEQQQQELAALQQAQIAENAGLMSNQAQQLLAAWEPPKQSFVQGNKKDEKQEVVTAAGRTNNSTLPEAGAGPIIGRAGDILFAIIETSINSDEPGPVMARIVTGPLKGAKILGSFQRQDKKLMLSFNTLSVPDVPESIGIDAIAIDPETARTALATNVDNHYLTKYGSLIAASFLEGMGTAVETSLGTPELNSDNSATIASQIPATSRDQIIVGLGKVGQRIATEIDQSDIQPTVTLDSGTGVGLLLMSDLRVEQSPEPVTAAAPDAAAAGMAGAGAPVININMPGTAPTEPATNGKNSTGKSNGGSASTATANK